MSDLDQLSRDLPARIAAASDPSALEAPRVAALGKQAVVTALQLKPTPTTQGTDPRP